MGIETGVGDRKGRAFRQHCSERQSLGFPHLASASFAAVNLLTLQDSQTRIQSEVGSTQGPFHGRPGCLHSTLSHLSLILNETK